MDRLSAGAVTFGSRRNSALSRWVHRIEQSIEARGLFLDGQKILVAVSGGVDSMVLLYLLCELSQTHRWELTVAHFNHQLRGEASDSDEQLVLKTAHEFGLHAVSEQADVAAAARKDGVSLEMAARALRHDFLARTARRLQIPIIALAHHADDQVELFFIRLFRGTSGRGLAGMRWRNPSPVFPEISLVRPLLDQTKETLRGMAKASGLRFSEDATNTSLDLQRNRIRHELLPSLRQHYQPRLAEQVLRLMELTGADAEAVTVLANRWLAAGRRAKFDRLPVAVQRSALHLQLCRILPHPDFDLVERLRRFAGERVSVSRAQWVLRDTGGLVRIGEVEHGNFGADGISVTLSGSAGEVEFAGMELQWKIAPGTAASKFQNKPNTEYFDADKVGAKICLRHWQPGDRFQPIGMPSARKLQDLFTDLKVPRAQRHRRVVAVTLKGELFWVEGLRMAECFKLDAGTVRRLKWHWHR